ncbi:MAG: hypothetical protein J0649_00755 [Methylococcales bacterium]|jgi:hypothetical protein|nr:hypothetical protein [Methylococcales bacterium]
MINGHKQNNEVINSESEQLVKKIQFYWNLNKLEQAHANHSDEVNYAPILDGNNNEN